MLTLLLTIIDIIALVSSFFGNTFILVANALEWMKTKSINAPDKLICGIGFFSSLYEILKFCGYILQLPLHNLVVTNEIQRVSTVVCLSIMSCNIWISTWLSVTFCFRIVNIKHQFYMYFQSRFPKMVTWLLLPPVLVSFLLSLTFFWDVSETQWSNGTLKDSPQNASASSVSKRRVCLQEAFVGFNSFGFLLSLVSLVTIIKSIYRHMEQMKKNGDNFQNLNLEVHIRATKTIALLLLLNFFFCYGLVLTAFKGNDSQWTHYIYIFTSVWYALNSLNIIMGNRKLKRRFFASFIPCSHYRIQNNTGSV